MQAGNVVSLKRSRAPEAATRSPNEAWQTWPDADAGAASGSGADQDADDDLQRAIVASLADSTDTRHASQPAEAMQRATNTPDPTAQLATGGSDNGANGQPVVSAAEHCNLQPLEDEPEANAKGISLPVSVQKSAEPLHMGCTTCHLCKVPVPSTWPGYGVSHKLHGRHLTACYPSTSV